MPNPNKVIVNIPTHQVKTKVLPAASAKMNKFAKQFHSDFQYHKNAFVNKFAR